MSYSLQNRNIIFAALLLLLCLPCTAQEVRFVQLIEKKQLSADANKQSAVKLRFQVKEGYHIMAHRLKDDSFIPTSLEVNGSDLEFNEPTFPEGKKFYLAGSEAPLEVYSGEFDVTVPFESTKPAGQGMLQAKGALYYQACDDTKCYYPRNLNFTLEIRDQE